MEKNQGKLVVISAPSGAGKNSVIQELLKRIPGSTRLVTTTTRAARPGEVDGVDYHFLSRDAFEQKITTGDFVEWAEYAGNLYGMQKKHVDDALQTHSIVFANPDVQGKQALDRLHISHLSIFLAPEALETLRARILKRGGTDVPAVEERLLIAEEEMRQSTLYDVVIVNKEGKMIWAVEEIVQYLVREGVIRQT